MTEPVTCERFDERADDLALGQVEEPDRSRLLEHAAHCDRCRSLLDDLGTVVDRVVLAAPEHEPPAGFESRVLERLGHAAPAEGRPRTRLWLAVAAAVVLVIGATAVAVVRSGDGAHAPTAAIVASDSSVVGQVQLLAEPVPYVLVTVDRPRPAPGTRHCELQLPDGSWVRVGSWEVADIAAGAWAAGIDPALLDATGMRIVTDDGTVLATATF